jgi:hypothetical protein
LNRKKEKAPAARRGDRDASRFSVSAAVLFRLAMTLGIAAAAGCGGSREPPASRPPAADPETQRMVERLAIPGSAGRGFGFSFDLSPEIKELETYLARPVAPQEALVILIDLADMKNQSGDPQGALESLGLMKSLITEGKVIPSRKQADAIRYIELTSHLRLGEIRNCIANHNRDCCIFPLKDGGLHGRREAFQTVERLLLEELRANPRSLGYRWLLTIVSMALDKYPDGSDPSLLIDAKVFESGQPFPRFPEVATEIGVDVDDIAGGAILDDFTNDGALDIMLSSWARDGQLRFFVNGGNGRFVERTREAGLEGITGGLNMVQTDHDNDGYLDVYIVRGAWLMEYGKDPDSLLRNNGDGTFSDRTESSGLLSFAPALSAVWADFTNDGWIDLLVGQETNGPVQFPLELYVNRGNGTFVECAKPSGLAVAGFTRGVVAGDYDNDGWSDIYVSRLGQPNLLFRNQGRAAGPGGGWLFEEVGRQAGVTEPLMSFPCWFWDHDNDGWLDILVCGYTLDFSPATLEELVKDMVGQPSRVDKARLYRNNRDGTFRDVTAEVGLARVIYAMGANFGDLDNDGFLDFYAGTGDPNLTTLIPNLMFRNDGGRRFIDVTTAGGFGHLQKGHGVAFGDIDNDGSQEVLINMGGAVRGDNFRDAIFKNPGSSNRWLKLSLAGTTSNRAAIGARVKVVVAGKEGERAIHRVVGSGGSFGASTLRLEVGLGDSDRIKEMEVRWPASGKTERFTEVEMNSAYTCREGEGRLVKMALPRP